ncbi:hypothetical protein Rhe02_61900 [Rhizocola hellebori]|uniref:Uncharacterized protein n=1 Tax=Rhizocola hellebori TaxID=1392758 RepID=A0A8J3QEE9_9ACTN|nr:hypothetical protein [Rhizocola hellebori]GIH08123.1 hypothetical protein Rhe02_61900 [Rhizocola hellebori]
MRRLLGLLVLLYGLLLALNTTAPGLAELAGDKVTAHATGDSASCTAVLARPPFGGLYGNCPASWSGSQGGRLFGADVAARLAADSEVAANTYPLLDDYAVLPPSNSDQVAGIIALLIVLLGIMLLVSERKRRGGGRPGYHDHDSDTDSDSGSDSGESESVGSGGDGGGDSGGSGD